MREELSSVLNSETEVQNGDAGEGVCEPRRAAIAFVVAQHRLAEPEALGELASRPPREGTDRIDAVERRISVEFHVLLPWLASSDVRAQRLRARQKPPAQDS